MASPAAAAAPATLTGAERLLAAAVEAGVQICFANPGAPTGAGSFARADAESASLRPPPPPLRPRALSLSLSPTGTSEMHFVAALDSVPGVRAVLGLHETVCSGAADGYARMARRPALALLHLGPGLANALANLHNARRAGSPLVALVGDMATWHKGADALLDSDVAALARVVSKAVVECAPGGDLGGAMARACAATRAADTTGGSRVATIIVPHDLSWERQPRFAPLPRPAPPPAPPSTALPTPAAAAEALAATPGAEAFVRDCAAALLRCPRGKAALYVGGRAALADGGALEAAGRVAAATGAALLCENAFTRLDRGAGRAAPRRLPYFPQDAAAALARFSTLVLLDARRPVANFGYEGGPSRLVRQPDADIWEFDSGAVDVPAALALLADTVGGARVAPGANCGGTFAPPGRPPLPAGQLTAAAMCAVVAALQPEGVVVVDESLTSGNAYWAASAGCPPFSHLSLTGGAIGSGPPLAAGAALACPGRVVVNLQADGSAMYALQALWTQARERLRVVTVVCANRVYAILKVEMAKQRIGGATGRAARALTEVGDPVIDWVAVGAGLGVPSSRAATCEELATQFAEALEREGPSLIEAVL
jgi:acetolactate synthase-1/2/3 large subunit